MCTVNDSSEDSYMCTVNDISEDSYMCTVNNFTETLSLSTNTLLEILSTVSTVLETDDRHIIFFKMSLLVL